MASAATVASVAARLWLLSTRPLWHDEVFTVWASRLSPGSLLRALSRDSGPPLFYLMEKPFVAAAEALRLPDSAARLLPFLALALLLAGARSLPPGGARRRFLLLSAACPFLLLYAAEARAYAVLGALGLGLFLLCDEDAPGARRTLLIALAAAALLWTHYLAVFLVGSVGAVAVARRRWRCAIGIAAGIALFLPWVPRMLSQPPEATAWMRESGRASAIGFLAALGGGMRVPPTMGPPLPEPLLLLSCAAATALLALLLLQRPARARSGLAVVLLTLGGVLAASLWRPAAFAGRSEMAVLPIWLWVLARAGEESRALRRAAGAAAAIGAVASLLLLAAPRPAPHFARLVAELESRAKEGDAVVATANLYLPARLARDRGRFPARLLALPPDLADHPGWFLSRPPSESDYAALEAEISGVGSDRSVFLLLDRPFWTERLARLLAARAPARPLAVVPEALLLVSPAR